MGSFTGSGGLGGYIRGDDDFEEALQRSLRDDPSLGGGSQPSSSYPPTSTTGSSQHRPTLSTSPSSAWGARSFATALHAHTTASTYGKGEPKRSKEEEEEISALWAKFERQEGGANRAERGGAGVGESSTGSAGGGGGVGGGGKKKKKGQKVLLTGGGRRGA